MADELDEVDSLEADTGSAEEADSQTPTEAPEAVEDAHDDTGSADDADSQDDGDDGSLTDHTEEKPEQVAEDDPATLKAQLEALRKERETFEKRWKDTQSAWTKDREQLKRFERYQDVDLDQAVESFKQQQARVPVWDERHPQHDAFLQKHSLYEQFMEDLQAARSEAERYGMDPQKAAEFISDRYAAKGLTTEDVKSSREFQQAEQRWLRDVFRNPQKALQPLIERGSMTTYQQQVDYTTRYQASLQILQDEKNAPLVREHLQEIQEEAGKLPPNAGPEEMQRIIDRIRDRRELELLRKKVVEAEKAKSHAQEQQRLAKGRATAGRDVEPSKDTSPEAIYAAAKKEAADQGIEFGSKDWYRLLREMEDRLT